MERSDPQWALDTLNDHIVRIENTLRFSYLAKEEQRRLQHLCDSFRDRYDEIRHSTRNGAKVDLYPEFQMLCEEIEELQYAYHDILINWVASNTKLTSIGSTLISITCVETLIGSLITFLYGGMRLGNFAFTYVNRSQKLKQKIERMGIALGQNADLRFRSDAIGALGIDGFQRINDTNARNALPR